jgi:hypothetical protein
VDLDSQTLTIAGTANEIETSASGQTITIGLPSTITANVTGNVAGNLTGTVLTAAQTNITSVGTLSSLAVSGNSVLGSGSEVGSYRATLVGNGVNVVGGLALNSNSNLTYIGAVSTTSADFEIFNSANGYIRLATNNVERMRIDASGNVGIGTSSPAYKMEIDGGSAETRLRISTSGTDADEAGIILANSGKVGFNDGIQIAHGAGVTTFKDLAGEVQMAIDVTNSRVGIGTSSPATLVNIAKSSDSGSGSTFPRLSVVNTLATQGDGSSTFNFSDLNISSGNGAVNMFVSTFYAAGAWEPGGQINVATNHPLIVKTNNTERMRIDSSGNVLIGETSISSNSSPNALRVKGGVHSDRGQFSAAGSTTTNIVTLASESKNQTYLLSVRQADSAANNVMGYVTAFAGAAVVVRMAQDNTNPALDLDFDTSGLTLRLLTGSGYGTTTWDWVLTRLG